MGSRKGARRRRRRGGGLVSRLDDAERTVRDLQQKLNAARNDNDALRSQKESNEDLQGSEAGYERCCVPGRTPPRRAAAIWILG